MLTTVICKAIRPTTNSIIRIMVPQYIGTDPYACTQWIGEEFDWQFVPMKYEIRSEQTNEKETN